MGKVQGPGTKPTSLLGKCMSMLTSTFGLFLINLAYLLMGAWLFYEIEAPHEETLKNNLDDELANLVGHIVDFREMSDEYFLGNVSEKLTDYEKQLATFYRKRANFKQGSPSNQSAEDFKLWRPYGAIIYCFSVITTIGWGNIVPGTVEGKLGTIIYGLNGMPLLFTLSSDVSSLCSRIIFLGWQKVKEKVRRKPAVPVSRSRSGSEFESEADRSKNNLSQNRCFSNTSCSSTVTSHPDTSCFCHMPSQGQHGELSADWTWSSSHLKNIRSSIDFLLYASHEESFGRTPRDLPRYRIRNLHDAVLLCKQFSLLSADDMVRCMDYVGFDYTPEDLRKIQTNIAGVSAIKTASTKSVTVTSMTDMTMPAVKTTEEQQDPSSQICGQKQFKKQGTQMSVLEVCQYDAHKIKEQACYERSVEPWCMESKKNARFEGSIEPWCIESKKNARFEGSIEPWCMESKKSARFEGSNEPWCMESKKGPCYEGSNEPWCMESKKGICYEGSNEPWCMESKKGTCYEGSNEPWCMESKKGTCYEGSSEPWCMESKKSARFEGSNEPWCMESKKGTCYGGSNEPWCMESKKGTRYEGSNEPRCMESKKGTCNEGSNGPWCMESKKITYSKLRKVNTSADISIKTRFPKTRETFFRQKESVCKYKESFARRADSSHGTTLAVAVSKSEVKSFRATRRLNVQALHSTSHLKSPATLIDDKSHGVTIDLFKSVSDGFTVQDSTGHFNICSSQDIESQMLGCDVCKPTSEIKMRMRSITTNAGLNECKNEPRNQANVNLHKHECQQMRKTTNKHIQKYTVSEPCNSSPLCHVHRVLEYVASRKLVQDVNKNNDADYEGQCTIYSSGRGFDIVEDPYEFISGHGFRFTALAEPVQADEVKKNVVYQQMFQYKDLAAVIRERKAAPVMEKYHMPLFVMYAFVILYVLFGSLIFFIYEENTRSSFWDALYFVYVMLSTTGFGDLLPSPYMYAFSVVYALVGMALYNIMINATLELFLEVLEYVSSVGSEPMAPPEQQKMATKN